MGADVAELVNLRETAEDRPVTDGHVPGQAGVVAHDDVIAEVAIVGDVHVGHDPVVIADARAAATFASPSIKSAILANDVPRADLKSGLFASELFVLRRPADRAKLMDFAIGTDVSWPFDHDMRADLGARVDPYIITYQRPWTDVYIVRYLGVRRNTSERIDQFSASRNAPISSASATVVPSTDAIAPALITPRAFRFCSISMRSWSPGPTG